MSEAWRWPYFMFQIQSDIFVRPFRPFRRINILNCLFHASHVWNYWKMRQTAGTLSQQCKCPQKKPAWNCLKQKCQARQRRHAHLLLFGTKRGHENSQIPEADAAAGGEYEMMPWSIFVFICGIFTADVPHIFPSNEDGRVRRMVGETQGKIGN